MVIWMTSCAGVESFGTNLATICFIHKFSAKIADYEPTEILTSSQISPIANHLLTFTTLYDFSNIYVFFSVKGLLDIDLFFAVVMPVKNTSMVH